MESDINGTSQCANGEESYEFFTSLASRKKMVQYDYRTKSGKLFSTVAPDLGVSRRRRDAWLKHDLIAKEERVFELSHV